MADRAQPQTGECKLAESPPLWLIVITVSVYLGFTLAYGEQIFAAAESIDCNEITDAPDCISGVFGLILDLLSVIFLGGFDSPLPILIQGPLLVFFFFAWGPILLPVLSEVAKDLIDAVLPG